MTHKVLLDGRSGDVLVYGGATTGKPALRLRPAAALMLAQQMAAIAGVAVAEQARAWPQRARDVRVGDLVDLARMALKK